MFGTMWAISKVRKVWPVPRVQPAQREPPDLPAQLVRKGRLDHRGRRESRALMVTMEQMAPRDHRDRKGRLV
jgi:hypothetical protein